MTDINKQKFLAELAQLLTFMYEEDRQDALMVYSAMFDEASDEQALIQSLVSPIRQAVLVARAYNATERKLQTHSQSRSEAGAERDDSVAPDFLQTIFEIRAEAMSKQAAREEAVKEDKNQFSLFDLSAQAAAPAEAPAPEAESADADSENAPSDDPVDAFMEEFHLPEEGEEAPAEKPDDTRAEEPAAPSAEASDEKPSTEALLDAAEKAAEDDEDRFVVVVDGSESSIAERTVRKPRVLLLLLYILLAIPVTLVGIVLLLIPALLCLGLAALAISVGVMAVSSVFGGFAVLADLLVVLGASLVLLALGLLFLWLFIWFLFGAIGGLIRGVCALGRKWCYKEVPAI